MTFLKRKTEYPLFSFGLIVGNRDVFPDTLAKNGREELIELTKDLGYNYIILNELITKNGVVETYEDAKKCAELFKQNREKIVGLIVCIPNFSDEYFPHE